MDINRIIAKSPFISDEEYIDMVSDFKNKSLNNIDYFVNVMKADEKHNTKKYDKSYAVIDLTV